MYTQISAYLGLLLFTTALKIPVWNDVMKRIRLWPQPTMHDSTWKYVYFCFHTITISHIFCNDMSFTCETLVNSRWTNLYVRRQPLFILIKGLKCDSSISGFKHQIIIKTRQRSKQNKIQNAECILVFKI